MRPIPLLFAISLPLSLAACATRPCGDARPGASVHITVGYAADGTPTVQPTQCRVKTGVEITWRGPAFDDTTFQLTFDGNPGTVTKGSAGRSAGIRGVVVESEAGPLGREAGIRAENPGSYKYDVDANGRSLDPHIIIER